MGNIDQGERSNMPSMPRLDDKSKKIAFKILGIPVNNKKAKDKKKSNVEKRLTFEETTRVR